MPPHCFCVNLSRFQIIRSFCHQQFHPKLSPSPLTVLTAEYPFLSILQRCKDKDQLNQIHGHMISTGLIHNPLATTKLVSSFASNPLPGTTCVARRIAERVDGLDTYTWNTIMRGYLEEENPQEVILVYAYMRIKGLRVDSYSLLFVSKACGLQLGVVHGKLIHGQVLKMGFVYEIILVTSLVQMYGIFDDPKSSRKMFDESPQRDIVLWNALVAMYAQRNYPYMALSVIHAMVNEKVRPNEVTAVTALTACSFLRSLKEGKQIHSYVIKNLVSVDMYVYNALIDMYSKCGCLINARQIFQRMPVKSVVSWTLMIMAYSEDNYMDEALALFKEMDEANVKADEVTLLGIVSMCSKIGSYELSEWIDEYIKKSRIKERSVCMDNALMDMHAKCGNIKRTCDIFNRLEEKTVVSWTSMIQGLATHGHGIPALTRFSQMQREGFKPDNIVFLSILSACSHSGLVDEGRKCFRSMIDDYEMEPQMEHYGCMVDLLCRAGLVTEAVEFVEDMPINPDVIIWRMLHGACRSKGDTNLASRIIKRLLELEPEDSANYILLSNIYAATGEWFNVEEVRAEMAVRGVSKSDPGYSLVGVSEVYRCSTHHSTLIKH